MYRYTASYLLMALLVFVAGCWPTLTRAADVNQADATDYSQAANWVCRPGAETICERNLDALVLKPDGSKTVQAFTPDANAPIDCFYIYPTVSREQSPFADLTDSPEIQRITNAQVGRLSSHCRVFSPIYRQATLAHLREVVGGNAPLSSNNPMLDVQAAWAYYLAHDNHGRGVVLIGHSQGTILLQKLIAESIDGQPAQQLLVAAFLAGDPSLAVPSGQDVGGTFAHISTCTSAAQVGCVYAWGSYLAGDHSAPPNFGRVRRDGLVSACANPALVDGAASLKFYYPKPQDAPTNDPPWVEAVGLLSGQCEAYDGANIFVVSIKPGSLQSYYTTLLTHSEAHAGWGLHPRDIALIQGNMLDVLSAKIATWKTRPSCSAGTKGTRCP